MTAYETALATATHLPVGERIQLMDALWDTLPDDALPALGDEWVHEIERRSAEFDAGKTQTVPWATVKAEVLRRHIACSF